MTSGRLGLVAVVANDLQQLGQALPAGDPHLAGTEVDLHVGRWIASLYGNLSAPERKQLATLLEKVADNLAGTAP